MKPDSFCVGIGIDSLILPSPTMLCAGGVYCLTKDEPNKLDAPDKATKSIHHAEAHQDLRYRREEARSQGSPKPLTWIGQLPSPLTGGEPCLPPPRSGVKSERA